MSFVARYAARGADARAREVVTPENVSLGFTIAAHGDRIGAFILDILFMGVALTAVAVVVGLAGGGPWLEAFLLVAAFVIRNFYFVIFETRWQGQTPGKRIVRTRVMDARGGQLEVGAILARNLTRELEFWQPLAFLFTGHTFWPGAPWWATLLAGTWLFICAAMPLFNRDRLRIGDMLAGTRVMEQPQTLLLHDLADAAAPPTVMPMGWHSAAPAAQMFAFTAPQLDIYGIYELQVLEGVLRGEANSRAHLEALATVAAKIHSKIRYQVAVQPHHQERFLRDFYTALRAHLEKKMLFGQRREDKNSR